MLRQRFLTELFLLFCLVPFTLGARQGSGSLSLRRITNTSPEVINLNPSLSGDGRQVAFESTADLAHLGGGPSFHGIRASLDTEPLTFYEFGRSRAVAPSISQDGSVIVFSSAEDLIGQNSDRNPEIFLQRSSQLIQVTNTRPESTLTRLSEGSFQPSITDDGQSFVFAANRDLVGLNSDLNFEIFVFEPGSQTISQITDTKGIVGATDPKISGDGSKVVFTNDRGEVPSLVRDLVSYTISDKIRRTIHTNAQSLNLTCGRAISDNGLRIVYSMELSPNESQVFLFDSEIGQSIQITNLGSRVLDVALNPTISGDGKRLTFATRRRVTAATDGSVELYLFDIPSAEFMQLTNAPPSATADVVAGLNDNGSLAVFSFPRVLSADAAGLEEPNNSEIFAASVPSRPSFGSLTVLNGASLSNAPVLQMTLPVGGIVIAQGRALSQVNMHGARTSAGTFPLSLAGTSIAVNGIPAQVLYVSPTQVNFVVPAESQSGSAEIVISNSDGFQSRATTVLSNSAPGIFTSLVGGHGGGVLLDSRLLLPEPFDPTNGQLRLSIFATGVRNATNVSCTISGHVLPIETVVPSPDLPGLDEIHLLVPADLRGAGQVNLIVTADGVESNSVTVTFGGNAIRDIVINEILADPPEGLAGDANHDGIRTASDDEFVELINSTTNDLDLSGYQLQTRAVNGANDIVRHRFPTGSIVPSGTALVVFGGGTIDPSNPVFAGAKIVKASTGGISLSNTGGIVTVRDETGSIVSSVQFGTSVPANHNQSITRFPDITGGFVLHTLAPDSQERAYSPGARTNGAPFAPTPVPSPSVTPLPTPSPSVTPSPIPSPSASPDPTPLPLPASVISQIFGGGGNSGAPFKNDFIEIRNNGTSDVDLSGWSVQYASATSSSWSVTNLTSVRLSPGQYYLIQEGSGGTSGQSLPAPDAMGTINLAATSGKIALVNTRTALVGACPSANSIVDLVGYGTTANCVEGSGPAPSPSNTVALLRAAEGCIDTQNNTSDFLTGTANPRNSTTAFSQCPAGSLALRYFTTPLRGLEALAYSRFCMRPLR